MRIITLLSTVIMSGVLVGCSTTPDIKNAPPPIGGIPPVSTFVNTVPCSVDGCLVKIDVIGNCKFDVPAIVRLSGIRDAIHGVIWVIQSRDYVFSSDVALFPKDSADRFFGRTAVIGRVLAVEVTVATPGQSHGYGLNIAKRAGGACGPVDPFIFE